MSSVKTISRQSNKKIIILIFGVGLFAAAMFLTVLGILGFKYLSLGQVLTNLMSWLFATNSTHTTWYITRAAGWVAYFLLWFSMVWGLVIPTKFFGLFLSPTFSVDFHEYISLLSIGFVILHIGVLLIDRYLPFTLTQILVPFISPYRPMWVGLGVIGFYLSLLVTITFYLRNKIGQKKFKAIHTLSLAAYLGVVLHSLFTGSDSSIVAVQIIYLSTFMVVVFLTSYWVIRARQIKKEKNMHAILSSAKGITGR
jgi:predicted ferric reductase